MDTRPARDCRYDVVGLGEVMLRLDPGDGRVRTARSFTVWEGGGEYNVARSLRRCFGLRTAIVTALPDSEIGRLVEDLILQGGVDTSLIRWSPYDGIGRRTRVGLNFTERGFGVRAAVGVSDRGNSAASQLTVDDVDWDDLFGRVGVRWLHTGGIFAGLSEASAAATETAMRTAKKYGTMVSFDLNYRASLWQDRGGVMRSQEVNRALLQHADVVVGDFSTGLGVPLEGAAADVAELAPFADQLSTVAAQFDHLVMVATPVRVVHSASCNDWGAIAYGGGRFYHAPVLSRLQIYDRIGAGDGFAAGLVYGLMELGDPQAALDYGAAHGALVMTTPGDTSMVSLAEVRALVLGESAQVRR
jgi:2-dehydro-3-deoxygluconokinase